jgi:hypothetical protein
VCFGLLSRLSRSVESCGCFRTLFPAGYDGGHVQQIATRLDCVGDPVDAQLQIAMICDLQLKMQIRKGIQPQGHK